MPRASLLALLLLGILAIPGTLTAQTVDYLTIAPLPGNNLLGVDVGCVRVTPSGVPASTEAFQALGWNDGANGMPEAGGGDDVPLGVVSASWSWQVLEVPPVYGNPPPSQLGTIDAATGVFTAGPGPATARGLVTATYAGATSASVQIYVLPPDFVTDPPAAVHHLHCEEQGGDAVLSWIDGTSYDSIEVLRDGVVIATLGGSAVSYTDAAPPTGDHEYHVRGVVGGATSPERLCIVEIGVDVPPQLIWLPHQGIADGAGTVTALENAFQSADIPYVTVDTFYGIDLSEFGGVWATMGSFIESRMLQPWEGTALADYVAAGGSLYMEGGEVWTQPPTDLQTFSGIVGLAPFTGPVSTVTGSGQGECDLSAYTDGYTGNAFQLDRLGPAGPEGWVIWYRNSTTDGIGVYSQPPGSAGRIIGTSWFLGGYSGDTTALVMAYLQCLQPATVATPFIRGDANGDQSVNLGDAITSLTHLFLGGPIACEDAADFDDSETLDLADPINLLTYLFSAGPPPAPPFPSCGLDPAGTTLGCAMGCP